MACILLVFYLLNLHFFFQYFRLSYNFSCFSSLFVWPVMLTRFLQFLTCADDAVYYLKV